MRQYASSGIAFTHPTRRSRLCVRRRPCLVVPGFDGLDGLAQLLFQHALADDRDHDRERPSLEVLAFADHDDVDGGRPFGRLREGIGVARVAAPYVGVGGPEYDVVWIGPVIVQAFPDAARALGHVGLTGTLVVNLEVVVGAVAEKLRA